VHLRHAARRKAWPLDRLGDRGSTLGAAKARAIENLARNAKLDLRQSHAYGNSVLDAQLLCVVGHAHAVNPGRALAALGNEND